jgi:copper(I)-binding protein
MKLVHLLLTSLLIAPVALANNTITFEHAYARATPPKAPNSAVFAEIHNQDDKERIIVSASTEAANRVELHNVIIDGDIMKMRQIEQMVIPAKGVLILKPGSLHIMLLGLKKPLNEGDIINVTLHFADGGVTMFDAPVKKVMQGITMKPSSMPTPNNPQ